MRHVYATLFYILLSRRAALRVDILLTLATMMMPLLYVYKAMPTPAA